jgi:MarR family transcriptional regulator, organic hydroperoxide resistance regulator
MPHGSETGPNWYSKKAARLVNGVGTFRGPLTKPRRRDDPGVPASLARWTGFAVITAAHEAEYRYGRCLVTVGISLRDFVVLSEISQRSGISQGALAERLGLGRSRISEQLTVLDQAGFIERELNPFDLRRRRLWLSVNGVRALEEARALMTRADDAWLSKLGRQERPAFRAMLSRIPPNHAVRWEIGPPASASPTSGGTP